MISRATRESGPQVKGVSARPGITLISLDHWVVQHDDGFVIRALALFRRHAVGVALIATSPNNVTVTLDPDEPVDVEARQALLDELSALCHVRVVEGCAVISLVGRRIRSILPLLAPAFRVFEEQQIHLVSQAANDLNFSFVVNQKQMPRLVSRVHDSVVKGGTAGGTLGPTWEAMFDAIEPPATRHRDTWWIRRRGDLIAALGDRQHAFVYDAATLCAAAESLLSMPSVDRVLYAMKANFNPGLLQLISAAGVDFECVSPGEVQHLKRAVPGIGDSRILFTPNFAPRAEYEWAVAQGLQLTLDNLFPLRAWPELFAGVPLFIRIDPGQGQGHHEHVRTGGVQSKFGVPAFEVDELEALVERAGARVVGIHAHAGSGIPDPDNWRVVGDTLARVAERFPDVEVLDLGGGLGVPDRVGEPPFDLDALDAALAEIKTAWPRYRLWLEPGRYLVARCGVLLARVTQTKGKGEHSYVGISTGMNSLIRPALYGAWHEIVNLTRAEEPATDAVTVVGPICETGDRLGTDRMLPPCRENDILLIANAGAYGRAMSSRYNLREPADELIV
ncbi:MAG: hypothetical protein U5K76_05305 [Woeseiaceae bacterium]|nr:hypothetical protein [Woeseiaceae bacterium]